MEGHFVYYSQKYQNLESALGDKGGVAVFAVFYQVTISNTESSLWEVCFSESTIRVLEFGFQFRSRSTTGGP